MGNRTSRLVLSGENGSFLSIVTVSGNDSFTSTDSLEDGETFLLYRLVQVVRNTLSY